MVEEDSWICEDNGQFYDRNTAVRLENTKRQLDWDSVVRPDQMKSEEDSE